MSGRLLGLCGVRHDQLPEFVPLRRHVPDRRLRLEHVPGRPGQQELHGRRLRWRELRRQRVPAVPQVLTRIALAIVLCGCSVTRRSESLKCDMTTPCAGGGTCVEGYCVSDSNCPKGCATCDPGASPPTCMVEGTMGSSFTCPSGFQCMVDCSADGACGSITCDSGASCDITCSDANACGNITCNGGPCSIHCIAPQGCKQVNCSNSCACDVACPIGDCTTLQCPHRMGNYCTASGANNEPCESSPPGCNQC